MKKVLIAINSFKESKSSIELNQLVYNNLSGLPLDLYQIPVSDGGNGFVDTCRNNFKGRLLTYDIINSYNGNIKNYISFIGGEGKCYVETNSLLGYDSFPVKNPLKYNSSNLGKYLKAILSDKEIQVKEICIGVGGTLTTDFGLGALGEFGLKLLNSDGNELQMIPENFIFADEIILPSVIPPIKIEFILDVENPLFGDSGGIKMFGRQKGLDDKGIELVEKGIERVISLLPKEKMANINLSGAGGGIANTFQIFFESEIIPAKEFILERLNINSKTINCDYLITGEGSFDNQSLQNKAPYILINEFASKVKNIFLICGKMDYNMIDKLPDNVIPLEIMKYFNSKEESMNKIETGITNAVNEIKKIIKN